jgi:hypothetical protein
MLISKKIQNSGDHMKKLLFLTLLPLSCFSAEGQPQDAQVAQQIGYIKSIARMAWPVQTSGAGTMNLDACECELQAICLYERFGLGASIKPRGYGAVMHLNSNSLHERITARKMELENRRRTITENPYLEEWSIVEPRTQMVNFETYKQLQQLFSSK